ncbi:MAG: VOC family protein [Saprospiraceae bacterium]
MEKNLWLNLPVKNLSKSKAFFLELGFKLNPEFGNADNCASFIVGDNKVGLMLFEEPTFKGFSQNEIANTSKGTEVLFSIGAENHKEVDDMAAKAVKAGGKVFTEPAAKDGWMYGCGFADLDGHRWNSLYMDMSKMPKKEEVIAN